MPHQDSMATENRFTVNSIQNMLDIIRTYQDQPVEPFPMNHPCKRDTAFLQFDEGHYLAEAYKATKKALECYKERYQIHIQNPTGEHEVVGIEPPHRWQRWSQRPEVQGIRERAQERRRVFEEK